MPIYEYVCSKCGKLNDVLQKMTDPAPAKCDACGEVGTLSKMVSRTSFVLKGGGWYSDLYGSTKPSASAANSKPSESVGGTAPAAPAASSSTPSTPAPAASSPAASTDSKNRGQ